MNRAARLHAAHSAPGVLVYRREQVLDVFGISESTLRRWIAREGFPRPRQLGPRVVGWNAAECHAWLAARPVAEIGKSAPRETEGTDGEKT